MKKTISMKLLEGKKIPYEAVTYPTTERDAETLAGIFGVPPAHVFKTLVVLPPKPKKPLLVLVQADRQLNPKKVAKAIGEKKVAMAKHSEAEKLTRLQVGGISPLVLLNKGFAIYADEPILMQSHVFVSAGQRGINLKIAVPDLLSLINAKIIVATDIV